VPVGLVVSSHGRHCVLEDESGRRIQAHPRGKRLEVVVGDRVEWAATQRSDEDQAVIEALLPRRNLMFRQDVWRTKHFAANLDQVLFLVCGHPMFSESQLMRAMIAADAADIPVRLILNKVDLPQSEAARDRLAAYRAMDLDLVEVSVKTRPQETLSALMPWLDGRTSLLLGASGTGKSSLLNLLAPEAASRVGDVSEALQSGKHTTTHTSWHWLDGERRQTALIDSPGAQEFGLQQIGAAQLAHHLPDFRPLIGECRFSNCMHQQEPGCAITRAVSEGRISGQRHRLYGEILQELGQTRW